MTDIVQKVVVVGASGFGREVLDVLEAQIRNGHSINIIGVIDDSPSAINISRLKARSIPYLGTIDGFIQEFSLDVNYVLGIGNPSIREKLSSKIEKAGYIPYSAIHPSVEIGSTVTIAPGVVICAGAVIATNVNLGKHVHINANVTVGHDATLEDFVSVNPAAVVSGEVLVKQQSLLGAGSMILQGLVVGRDAIVGACACVTKDVQNGAVVKGVPAK